LLLHLLYVLSLEVSGSFSTLWQSNLDFKGTGEKKTDKHLSPGRKQLIQLQLAVSIHLPEYIPPGLPHC